MHFASKDIPAASAYKLLTSTVVPRPIAFVTTISADGIVNAAPFSFFNAMGSEPPVVALGFEPKADGSDKDTPNNIFDTGEFVVNIVDENLASQMNICAGPYPASESEIEAAELATVQSLEVAPPRISLSPVSFECKLFQNVPLGGGGHIVIGEILHFHVRDDIIESLDPLRINVRKLDAIARLTGADYARTTDTFQIKRPT
ncbi:flavin reductase family protein [Kordiimonas sp. SCSIO 12610]|uniref:flavin reductase family protein n=1 Tax=Kordiimonas sp. SCSIO 12610 TaxID=2829597 RepID=UPI00210D1C3F|nr:flavin reductase family protein [Kordiimonas sp. SCSIO 12610]UTW56534.1 flavin reductase family protein [Kordiimonas sp. SCSIO 12610]